MNLGNDDEIIGTDILKLKCMIQKTPIWISLHATDNEAFCCDFG